MKTDLVRVQWYCPNCGNLVTGVRDQEGTVNIKCHTCFTVMVSKMMGRRHDRLDIYAPIGQSRVGA